MVILARKKLIDNEEAMIRWDWESNNKIGLDPSVLNEGNGNKAYFKCKNGHLEYRVINKEIDRGFPCTECKSIAFNNPESLKRWDWDKNKEIGLNPYEVGYNSNKKAYFICENGHEYFRIIQSEMIEGAYCPTCNSLGFCQPSILEIWSVKNKNTPFDYTRCSKQKVWFKCLSDKSHPDYLQSISNKISNNQGCPYCSSARVCESNSFGYYHKDKIVEWSDKNKKTPFEYTYGSKEKVYWKCLSDDSHPDYLQIINNKHKGYGCPVCRGVELGENNKIPKDGMSFGDVYDSATKIWSDKNKHSPFYYKPNSGKKVWFKCLNSETHPDYMQTIVHKYSDGTSCPVCSKSSITKINRILHERYRSLNPMLEYRINTQQEFFYVDVLIPSSNTIIEFDGKYWHKDILESDIYKTKTLNNMGYKVIRVREGGLETLGITSDVYYEIFSGDMCGYQYRSKGAKRSMSIFIKKIDEIIGFEETLKINDLVDSVRD